MPRKIPELAPLEIFAPHQRENVCPTTYDSMLNRATYTADLQWNRVSSLEPSSFEAETLPLGHSGPWPRLRQASWNPIRVFEAPATRKKGKGKNPFLLDSKPIENPIPEYIFSSLSLSFFLSVCPNPSFLLRGNSWCLPIPQPVTSDASNWKCRCSNGNAVSEMHAAEKFNSLEKKGEGRCFSARQGLPSKSVGKRMSFRTQERGG
ncbi:hypothetical protein AVEN_41861-1 [Araneus ventricosus]|uniref:Uncharacterized protein n=1 Tax=Araneus ventricosus TaxID=182803 RepID=A0A4Y2AE10_ARAVE|nr:hypothetical protein AVEN_41861-1 [Araneus ventricosus]